MAWHRQRRLHRVMAVQRWRFWRVALALLALAFVAYLIEADWWGSRPIVSGAFVLHRRSSLVFGHAAAPFYIDTLLNFVHNMEPTRFPRAWVVRVNTTPLVAIAALVGVVILVGRWNVLNAAAERIRRRRRKGYCAKCDYDLAGLPTTGTCPECGQRFRRTDG